MTVWHIPQVPMKAFRVPVSGPEEAAKVLAVLAAYDAFQYEHNVKPDYTNAAGVEGPDGDEYEDPDTCEEVGLDQGYYDVIVQTTKHGKYRPVT